MCLISFSPLWCVADCSSEPSLGESTWLKVRYTACSQPRAVCALLQAPQLAAAATARSPTAAARTVSLSPADTPPPLPLRNRAHTAAGGAPSTPLSSTAAAAAAAAAGRQDLPPALPPRTYRTDAAAAASAASAIASATAAAAVSDLHRSTSSASALRKVRGTGRRTGPDWRCPQ